MSQRLHAETKLRLISMPDEELWELAKATSCPVVVLGEDSSDEVWERVMEVEADLYLIKPLRYRELVAREKAILRRYKKLA